MQASFYYTSLCQIVVLDRLMSRAVLHKRVTAHGQQAM
jgi:hypothetical protein